MNNNIPKLKKRKDPACIIYTSGTQGIQKGYFKPWGILNNCEGAIEIKLLLKKINKIFNLVTYPTYGMLVQFVQITVAARVFMPRVLIS